MKKIIIILVVFFSAMGLTAQEGIKKYSISTSIGTGISMSEPSATPVAILGTGHYHINSRWSVGGGIGYSLYDNVSLIPLFTNGRFTMMPGSKFNLFMECSIGYAISPANDACGGFYLNPFFGVQRKFWGKLFFLGLGYELQQLERRKENTDEYFHSEFIEKPSFHSLSIKLGIRF